MISPTEPDGGSATIAADGAIDFIAAWRLALLHGADARIEAAADRAFWEGYARVYDARTAMPGSYDRTLAAIAALVRPTDTLLDVGAGTGRFALPLARLVRQVTALDYAPAMLALLMQHAHEDGVTNIIIREEALEAMTAPPHDVVLAAWSLYRQVDIRAALTALVCATVRTLVIAASDTAQAPHFPFLLAIWGRHGEPEFPAYLYLLGALRQLGYRADLRVLWETRRVTAPTEEEVARTLIPPDASPQERQQFLTALQPLLERDDHGWLYRYDVPVNLIIWHRREHSAAAIAIL